jgi:hypothetical protein
MFILKVIFGVELFRDGKLWKSQTFSMDFTEAESLEFVYLFFYHFFIFISGVVEVTPLHESNAVKGNALVEVFFYGNLFNFLIIFYDFSKDFIT